jgi:2-haloacid dehalogenase
MQIQNIIFDFGGVLVDWNPRHLFKNHFSNESEMEWFLENICTEEWNLQQDKGRSLAEATALLQAQFPEFHAQIQLFYGEWETMLKGDIPGSVALLHRLKEKYKMYGLTNWSDETIDIAYRRFSFFDQFDGIVVSGQEKMIKPDKQIYNLLLDRYGLQAGNTVFIDDNKKNIKAAEEIGLHAIHFENPEKLELSLLALNLL